MREFVYKIIIFFIVTFFLYHSTIGYTIYKFQNKIYSSIDKKAVGDFKDKIRIEIKNSLKKDKILKEEDALLLRNLIDKLSFEIKSAN
tara:strand:+ start:299 stop:562 length:264 start_codon:yes stop_codon:yes gene_type:complete